MYVPGGPHPVTGFDVCLHEFDGIGWAERNGVGGEYLVLRVGSLLVNIRRDGEEAQGWRFGFLADGDTRGVPGWYPPGAVSPIPRRYFRSVGNLFAALVMTHLP